VQRIMPQDWDLERRLHARMIVERIASDSIRLNVNDRGRKIRVTANCEIQVQHPCQMHRILHLLTCFPRMRHARTYCEAPCHGWQARACLVTAGGDV
jgi:hypothetical protein